MMHLSICCRHACNFTWRSNQLSVIASADVTDTQAVPREWSGFRAFLQSDFQAALFWFKHAQLALNFVLAATFVLLSDGLPWQQLARVFLNLAGVGVFSVLLVRDLSAHASLP